VLCFSQYSWVDEKGKKSKCPAPQYVDYVMTFTQNTIHDENVFPTKYGDVLIVFMNFMHSKIFLNRNLITK